MTQSKTAYPAPNKGPRAAKSWSHAWSHHGEITMAVEIRNRQLYCNTDDVSFGPIFDTDDEAEAFRSWLYREMQTDPRQLDDPSLRVAHRLFRRAHGQPEPEYEQNDRRYAATAALTVLHGRGWSIRYADGMWCLERGEDIYWSQDFERLIRDALARDSD